MDGIAEPSASGMVFSEKRFGRHGAILKVTWV